MVSETETELTFQKDHGMQPGPWSHWVSPCFSLGFPCFFLVFVGFRWFLLVSLGFPWFSLLSLGFPLISQGKVCEDVVFQCADWVLVPFLAVSKNEPSFGGLLALSSLFAVVLSYFLVCVEVLPGFRH